MNKRRRTVSSLLRVSICFVVGIFLGKYGEELIGSISNPMKSFLYEESYEKDRETDPRFSDKTHLSFHTIKKISEKKYGTSIFHNFQRCLMNGFRLYMDAHYLYVDRREEDTHFSKFISDYAPWIYSERARNQGLKIDKRTGWTYSRERERWEGNGVICIPFAELEKKVRKGLLDSRFRKRFGPPAFIWERPDGISYWEYYDVDFNHVIIAFKNHRFYNIGVTYVYEV